MRFPKPIVGVLMLVLAGCASAPSPQPTGANLTAPPAPGTYTGDLPCADCAGIRTTLNLRADGIFQLRQTYLDGGGTTSRDAYDIGRWDFLPETALLTLNGGREAPHRFAVRDAATLRQLDTRGRTIQSSLNYDLRRNAQPYPFSDTMPLRGLYTYMADAASLEECLTGKRFPVAAAGDNLNLERAYRAAPGAPLLITFDGHFEVRAGMEAVRSEEHVIVDRFQRAWPGETCLNRNLTIPLVGTYWVLTEVAGSAPPRVAGEQPWLELRSELGRVQGFTGCNRMSGRYELGADGLRLRDVATTRAFCVGRMDVEDALVDALNRATGYRIDGINMALVSGQQTLAWFQEGVAP
jgi:copper homeostasis protein (lipoprotein)